MNWNHVWMTVGLGFFLFGLYRQFPVQLDLKFVLQWVPLALICVGCGAYLYWKGGSPLLEKGFAATGKVSANLVPLLIWLMPMMGVGAVMAICFKAEISGALQGKGGLLGAFLAAWLSPTSQSLTGFVSELWVNVSLRPTLIYALIAAPLVSWNIFLIRQMGLGWSISLRLYGISFLVAILLMPVFWLLGKVPFLWN